MKKRNGFTLVETMGILILLAVILILVIPSLTKWLKGADTSIDDATKKLILVAAEDYVNESDNTIFNSTDYEYCLSLHELLDSGYISEESISKVVDQNISVKIIYFNGETTYEIVSECSIGDN